MAAILETIAAVATAVFTLVLAATSVWALFYAKRQLKQVRESEKIQHLLEMVEQFDTEPLITHRRTLAQKRLDERPWPTELQFILDFFETIGLLVRRGYLDADDVWNSFSYRMFIVYADARNQIEQERREDSTYYADFCWLIEQLRDIEARKNGKIDRPSREEIMELWRLEADFAPKRVRRRAQQTPQDDSSPTT